MVVKRIRTQSESILAGAVIGAGVVGVGTWLANRRRQKKIEKWDRSTPSNKSIFGRAPPTNNESYSDDPLDVLLEAYTSGDDVQMVFGNGDVGDINNNEVRLVVETFERASEGDREKIYDLVTESLDSFNHLVGLIVRARTTI